MNPQDPNSTPIMPSYEPPKSADNADGEDTNLAADLIRDKINNLYSTEPSAKEEVIDALEDSAPQSSHQEFMRKLATSGKPLAQIQTEWHEYYIKLSDKDKHRVWQEFYESRGASPGHFMQPPPAPEHREHKIVASTIAEPAEHPRKYHKNSPSSRTVADIKSQISRAVSTRQKVSKKQHLKSLIFGLSLGSTVVLILLFSFFNERFLAPFITPSRQVSSTPIIVTNSTRAPDKSSKVIIPKINVEAPVVYDAASIKDSDLQSALERGVVHYPTSSLPGEKGNVVIIGHSSSNIFNRGKYKFAFVLLSRMDANDVFYLTKGGIQYAYKIYQKRIVSPSEVSVLGPASKPNTATLITCDPPGLSINRLVVTGEQISPNPANNKASSIPKSSQTPDIIPSNAPSLWSRLVGWFRHD